MDIIKACNVFLKIAGIAKSPKKRGIVCINADHPNNHSHLDKFPINKPSEAKAAIKRINILTKAPKWWDGSLDELKSIVHNKISEHYNIITQNGKTSVIKKL